MHPWDLIEEGRYRDAIEAYTKRLRRDRSPQNFSGRAEAYFRLRDYDMALVDLYAAEAAAQSMHSTYYREQIGVVNWLADRTNTAAGVWLDLVIDVYHGKVQYADAAGGVDPALLLWFAGVSLGQPELVGVARRLIEKKILKRGGLLWSIDHWPGPVASYLVGNLDESQLRAKIDADTPILRERELCQTEFYCGVRLMEAGDLLQARAKFRIAASLHEADIESEYALAQREGRRRKPHPPGRLEDDKWNAS